MPLLEIPSIGGEFVVHSPPRRFRQSGLEDLPMPALGVRGDAMGSSCSGQTRLARKKCTVGEVSAAVTAEKSGGRNAAV